MDDDLEDEVIYQTMLTHLKLASKLVFNWPSTTTSSFTSVVGRHVRWYLSKPETILCGLAVIALLAAFNSFSAEKWWHCRPIVDRIILSFRLHSLKQNGNVSNTLQQNGRFSDNTSGSSNWELRRSNVGVYAIQGRRQKMEDRFSVLDFNAENADHKSSKVSLYGIFDGHGGDSAADFVEKNLFKNLVSRIESQRFRTEEWNFAELLSEEILSVDKHLLEVFKTARDLSGTTALVALVHARKLVVANVGDSRGVICDGRGFTIPLSFDHKPQQLKEQKRIKQAGGFVTFNGVWRVAGILATSRALGDYPLKDRNLIIADPDVLTFNVDDLRPSFMILASDGLWDTFSNEDAVAFVKGHLHEPDFGAKALTLQAYQRGSLDNITVIIVTFD